MYLPFFIRACKFSENKLAPYLGQTIILNDERKEYNLIKTALPLMIISIDKNK